MGKIGQKFGRCRGVGIGDTPGGESSPKLFGHGRVSKKKWTPLLLFIERKIPLNVLLADSGVQMGVSQIHPLLGGAHR